MPVPTLLTDLSTTPSSNYPAGSESPNVLDDTLRAHAALMAALRDQKQDASAISAFGLTLLDDADEAAARATLGGSTVGQSVFTAGDVEAARSALGVSAFVGFMSYRASGTTVTDTEGNFGAGFTEVWDVGSTHSGGTFTAPIAGWYRIDVSLGISASSDARLDVFVNVNGSNRIKSVRDLRSGLVDQATAYHIVQLALGDTVTLRLAMSTGATGTLQGGAVYPSIWSIVRVG